MSIVVQPFQTAQEQGTVLHRKKKMQPTQDFSCWFAKLGRKGRKSQLCGLLTPQCNELMSLCSSEPVMSSYLEQSHGLRARPKAGGAQGSVPC